MRPAAVVVLRSRTTQTEGGPHLVARSVRTHSHMTPRTAHHKRRGRACSRLLSSSERAAISTPARPPAARPHRKTSGTTSTAGRCGTNQGISGSSFSIPDKRSRPVHLESFAASSVPMWGSQPGGLAHLGQSRAYGACHPRRPRICALQCLFPVNNGARANSA